MPHVSGCCLCFDIQPFYCRIKLDSKDRWEEHEGKTVDDRMAEALKKRNIKHVNDSRPLEPEDFQRFDMIIGMNEENNQEVERAVRYWKEDLQKPIPDDWKQKVGFLNFAQCV